MNAKPKPEWPPWSEYRPLRSSYPSGTLLGGMPYRNSASTDLAETFARIRAASVKPIKGQA